MDKKRIGVKKIMSLGNWLANKILIPEADLIDEFLITHEQYKLRTRKQTEAMGMEVLDYILGRTDPDQSYTNLNIPSFFPAGVPGKNTPTNKDYQGDRAYQLWMKRVKSIATSQKVIKYYTL